MFLLPGILAALVDIFLEIHRPSCVVSYFFILHLGIFGRMNSLSKDCYAPAMGGGHIVSPLSLRMSVLSVCPVGICFPFIIF